MWLSFGAYLQNQLRAVSNMTAVKVKFYNQETKKNIELKDAVTPVNAKAIISGSVS